MNFSTNFNISGIVKHQKNKSNHTTITTTANANDTH